MLGFSFMYHLNVTYKWLSHAAKSLKIPEILEIMKKSFHPDSSLLQNKKNESLTNFS